MPTRSRQPNQPVTMQAAQSAALLGEMRRFARTAPKHLRVEVGEQAITLRRSLKEVQGYRTLVTPLLGLVVLSSVFIPALSNAGITSKFTASAIGLLLALAASLPIFYYCLVLLWDDVVVRINTSGVRVSYQPFPYPGKWVNNGEIEQLYTVGYERQQLNTLYDKRKKYETVYGVRVKTAQGKDLFLVGGFAQENDARYIEQLVEKSLGIRNTTNH